jgi:TPR repeat protein
MKVFVGCLSCIGKQNLNMPTFRFIVLLIWLLPMVTFALEPAGQTFSHTVYLQPYSKLRQSAEQGDAQAQYDLAYLYYKSGTDPEITGLIRSERLAAHWYREAALQGHASAQYNMAVLHLHGHGVDRDAVAAYAWLLQASANGHDGSKILMNELEQLLNARQIEEAHEQSAALKVSKQRPEFALDN